VALAYLVIGLPNQIMVAYLGAPLRFGQWASLAFASTLANYIFPLRAGAALRAGYLKRVCRFPFIKFASSMAVLYILAILVNSMLGLSAMAWIYMKKGEVSWPLVSLLAATVFICIGLILLTPMAGKERAGTGFQRHLSSFRAGWDLLRKNPSLLIQAALLSLVLTSLSAVALYVSFTAIGSPIDASSSLLLASLGALSLFISVTPAGIGIREAVILFTGMAVGVSPEASLLAGTLERTVGIVVALVLGPFGMSRITREMAAVNSTADQEGSAER